VATAISVEAQPRGANGHATTAELLPAAIGTAEPAAVRVAMGAGGTAVVWRVAPELQ
jgi:hypothetical protein